MENRRLMAQIARRNAALVRPQEEVCALNVAVVYEDTPALDWAMQHCRRAAWPNRDWRAQSSWWKVRYLKSPEVRFDAVLAARTADVIMVSIGAFEVSPPGLQEWIDAWVACRPPSEGTLIALIEAPEPARLQASYTREYWRAVANQGRLDYVAYERRRAFEAVPAMLEYGVNTP